MKFLTNYDLLEMINSANGNVNTKRIMYNELKRQLVIFGIYGLIDIIPPGKNEIEWLSNLMFCSGFFCINVSIANLLEKKYSHINEFKACIQLSMLVAQLNDGLNINTSLDLLKQAKLNTVEYEPKIIKGEPILMQNKYIELPTYDGIENIKNVSLLQEHEMFSKRYCLSLGKPQKKLELKFAFNN